MCTKPSFPRRWKSSQLKKPREAHVGWVERSDTQQQNHKRWVSRCSTQSEQMREFFIQVWKQNPALAKQGGVRVQALLTPLECVDAKEIGSETSGIKGNNT